MANAFERIWGGTQQVTQRARNPTLWQVGVLRILGNELPMHILYGPGLIGGVTIDEGLDDVCQRWLALGLGTPFCQLFNQLLRSLACSGTLAVVNATLFHRIGDLLLDCGDLGVDDLDRLILSRGFLLSFNVSHGYVSLVFAQCQIKTASACGLRIFLPG